MAARRRFGFLPHTLLWQTFLLIALVLTLALATWSQIFRHFQEPARAHDLSQMVVSVVNLTRTSLINAEPGKRTELLIDLVALEGIRIYPAEPGDETQPLPNTRPMRLLAEDVREQLGEHTRLASRWKTLEGFWVSFRLDPEDRDEFWVMLPADRLQETSNFSWLTWGLAALSVALLGAFVIVSRISSPLRSLARAARLIGRGHNPPRLAEDGPTEIATVARAFNQMAGDLARTDAERALLLAGVSHDLRTPLARLRLGVEMTSDNEDDIAPMVSDIEEMDRIIGQFLDFGRGESCEVFEQIDLAQLLQELSEPYRQRGINVRFDSSHPPVKATLQPLAIRRAIANLIDNAIRYAGESKPIDLSLTQDARELVIEVADRGPGIPESETAHLRQPFTRLDTARSDAKGAGLGLAIIDRIMHAHDGCLMLLPREGGGLRAQLHLPLQTAGKAKTRTSENRNTEHSG